LKDKNEVGLVTSVKPPVLSKKSSAQVELFSSTELTENMRRKGPEEGNFLPATLVFNVLDSIPVNRAWFPKFSMRIQHTKE
jgi:hypothetical protein